MFAAAVAAAAAAHLLRICIHPVFAAAVAADALQPLSTDLFPAAPEGVDPAVAFVCMYLLPAKLLSQKLLMLLACYNAAW